MFVPAEAARNIRNAVEVTNSQSYNVKRTASSNGVRCTLYAVLSGAALCFCFPTANWSSLAWIALVPLFTAVASTHSRARTIFLTWLAGFTFFAGSLHFLTFVDFAAWPALVFLESLFWIGLGFLLFEARRFSSRFFRILWVALSFTLIEFVRTEIPVWSFGLNLISHSQAFHPAMIQIASVGGAYLLSFLIIFSNACVAEFLMGKKDQRFLVWGAVLIAFLVYLFGVNQLKSKREITAPTLRLSVVQPNIPQSVKWATMAKKDIIEIHENLSKVAALREPDLIIWPEAAYPGYLNADYDSGRVTALAKSLKTPILVGAPYWESEARAFNSAFLLDESGMITNRYDKMKLVPFGEYVPWKLILGWLQPIAYTMGVGDFTAGESQKIFELVPSTTSEVAPVHFRGGQAGFKFAVLICFEDVFPGMARQAVKKGAKFLTVITNDAWFGPTGAPWQHMQSSILRAVENGVPVVRSGNTGVSGFISAEGRVLNLLRNAKDESLFVGGELTFELPMAQHNTFYRRGGYLFPYFCFLLSVCMYFMRRRNEISK